MRRRRYGGIRERYGEKWKLGNKHAGGDWLGVQAGGRPLVCVATAAGRQHKQGFELCGGRPMSASSCLHWRVRRRRHRLLRRWRSVRPQGRPRRRRVGRRPHRHQLLAQVLNDLLGRGPAQQVGRRLGAVKMAREPHSSIAWVLYHGAPASGVHAAAPLLHPPAQLQRMRTPAAHLCAASWLQQRCMRSRSAGGQSACSSGRCWCCETCKMTCMAVRPGYSSWPPDTTSHTAREAGQGAARGLGERAGVAP